MSWLVVLVDSSYARLRMLSLRTRSLFLDRHEEGLPPLKAEALEIGPRYNDPQVVALVDHFDL